MSWLMVAMHTITAGTYDEALDRLHRTGPEFAGWMSNHGPMAVEALTRRGSARCARMDRRLRAPARGDAAPGVRASRTDLAAALGDPQQLAAWIGWFENELDERPWEAVLSCWWPGAAPRHRSGRDARRDPYRSRRPGPARRADRFPGDRAGACPRLLGRPLAGRPDGVRGGAAEPASLVGTVPRRRQPGGRDPRPPRPAPRNAGLAGAGRHPPPPAAHVGRARAPRRRGRRGGARLPASSRSGTRRCSSTRRPHPTPWRGPSRRSRASSVAVEPRRRLDGDCGGARGVPTRAPGPARSAAPTTADEMWESAVLHGGEHVVKLADTALDVHARTRGDPSRAGSVTTAVALDV